MATLQFIKTKTFRIAAVILVLIGVYAFAGFWWAPRLVRSALLQDIPKTLGVTPAVGDIRINPFLFQAEIKDFSLSDKGEKLLGFERFFIDFELSSLWHRAYSFVNIDLTKPYVNAVIAQNGELNLLALRPKPTTPAKAEDKKTESVPALRIRSFKVSQGLLTYDDRSHPSDFATRLEPINFELHDFSTGVAGGLFTFTGMSKLSERIEWHGHLSVQPIESDGEFQIDGLQAHTVWDYLEDKLNFVVNSGKLDLHSTYTFSLKDAVSLQVDVSKIALSDLTVRPKNSDEDWIKLPELSVNDTKFDLAKRQVSVDSIALSGLAVSARREADGSINLMQLAASPNAAPSGAATNVAASPPPAPAPPIGAPWSVSLREFQLRDANISAEDRTTKPVTKLQLSPLTVQVNDISLDLSKPLKLTVDAKLNDLGSLQVAGTLTPNPLTADLSLKMSAIPLPAVQPYIAQFTSMTLMEGALNGDTHIKYGQAQPQLLFSGNISVAKLHTVDNALHDDFINWDNLDIQGVRFQQGPNRLDVDQVTARKLYARVIIEPDTSINVKQVLAGPGATVVVPGTPGTTERPTAVTAPSAPPPVPLKKATKKGAAAAPPPAKNGPPPMPMSIKKIILQDSEANFADLTVTPNFSTGIQKLSGTVIGISSVPKTRAKIDLKGQVDPYAPVTITGEANFLDTNLYTDIAMNFRNIELSTFNPYSGKFAGYNISKGKLSTELHYKVDGRSLDAQHHIVVDQLEFGDKTESKDAVSLPVKLAVALLKNRDGVIDLNFPVTGSLDDPKFKLGPLIWQVFVNILEKAVTAPFALLGSLFGGGPDLQFIDFAPGAAELDAAGNDKAQAMVKALNERPQLKIEVPIAAVKELDAPFLIDMQLKKQIEEAQAAGRKKTQSVPYEQLDPAAKADVLGAAYQKSFGAEAKYPDEVTSVKAKADLVTAKVDYLTKELRGHIKVNEADLDALGQQRAQNLQQALLKDTKIDPGRVFLVANDKAKSDGGKVRLELSLR
jgi:Domain of Unknown Function (DUF748)